MKLLYYCPLSFGGIADYTHDQANALQEQGVEVTVLCAEEYLKDRKDIRYQVAVTLVEEREVITPQFFLIRSRFLRRVRLGCRILKNISKLVRCARQMKKQGYRHLLLPYSEYLSPIWSRRLNQLRKEGFMIGAILHDPVRDYEVGPTKWHQWSVRKAYQCLDHVFVHQRAREEIFGLPDRVSLQQLAHGAEPCPKRKKEEYEYEEKKEEKKKWDIPEGYRVLLSFGHVRDNKNLDLVIKAIARFEKLFLVVSGKALEGGNRSLEFYQELARELGCDNRCLWINRYLNKEEVSRLFKIADLSVLTYGSYFHSASSALAITTSFRIPCLASSGSDAMKKLIDQYEIGIWVKPDSVESICQGLTLWLKKGVQPDWDRYFEENSWERNAEKLVETFFK